MTTVRMATPPKSQARKWTFRAAPASPHARRQFAKSYTRALCTHISRVRVLKFLLLDYGARGDPAKIAGSKIVFTSRPCLAPRSPQIPIHAPMCTHIAPPDRLPARARLPMRHATPRRLTTVRAATPPNSQARESTLRAAPACSPTPPLRASKCVCTRACVVGLSRHGGDLYRYDKAVDGRPHTDRPRSADLHRYSIARPPPRVRASSTRDAAAFCVHTF